jgi:hypothetical protein
LPIFFIHPDILPPPITNTGRAKSAPGHPVKTRVVLSNQYFPGLFNNHVKISSSSSSGPGSWITCSYTGNSDEVRITIATFVGVAWYNLVELNILILLTFKRYQGLYFWSMLIFSVGILPYSVGYLIKFFDLMSATWVSVTLLTWAGGLWSRASHSYCILDCILFSRIYGCSAWSKA